MFELDSILNLNKVILILLFSFSSYRSLFLNPLRVECATGLPQNTLIFQEIIGKTDVEIFTGGGVKESQDFKREVLERGVAAKREITFETDLFGSKTFLIYVEPVFSKAGETIGVNYMGMDVTDQVSSKF